MVDDKRLEAEYLALIDKLNAAALRRQEVIDRLREREKRPRTLHDPLWAEWDAADERVAAAREELRRFLERRYQEWRP